MYSGKRGHGQCLLVGHLVDPLGRVVAVRPGVSYFYSIVICGFLLLPLTSYIPTNMPPGGLKAQSPSGGDSLAVGEQITMTERLGLAGGFTRLLQGTEADATSGREGVGVALTTDRGYIFVPHNLGSDNVVFTDYCLDNDILLIHPFKEGEGAFHYNPNTNTFIFNLDEEDEVS